MSISIINPGTNNIVYKDKRFDEIVDGSIDGDIVFPDGTEKVREYLFASTQITSVQCPQSLTTIGKYSFQNCPLLSYANLQGVTTVDVAAFQSDSQLKSVTFGENLTSINNYAFMWTGLSGELDLSHTKLNTIGGNGMYGTNITKIILPSTLHQVYGGDAAYVGSLAYNGQLKEVIFLGYMSILGSGLQGNNLTTIYDFSNNGSVIPTFVNGRLGFKSSETLTIKIPIGQLSAWQSSAWATLNSGNVTFVEKTPTTIDDL